MKQRQFFKRRRQRGLTLVELIAALGLSAMLMAVLLGMVTRLSAVRETVLHEKPFDAWKVLLARQMQQDYVRCRSVMVRPNSIRMSGYASAGGTGAPTEIDYSIVSNEEGNWMYRTQRNLLLNPPNDTTKELVCRSIANFRSVTPLDTDVAPGILHLELLEIEQEKNENAKRVISSTKSVGATGIIETVGVNQPTPISVILIRHGGR